MIKIENLSKCFGKIHALSSVSLQLEEGVYGLLGPNGSGKTTLLRYLTGIYPDTTHAISFQGMKIRELDDYKSHLGYLPQHFGLFPNLSVMDALKLLGNLKEMKESDLEGEILRCLEAVGLSEKVHSKVKSLSGGMLRRVGIAQAMLGSPMLRFFDEPAAGLDPEERLRFKNLLHRREPNTISLISTHIVEDVEAICDRIIVMKEGKILFTGTQAELMQIAEGFVHLSKESELEDNQAVFLLKRQKHEGEDLVRILSDAPGIGQPVPATVEDGYMRLIHHENR